MENQNLEEKINNVNNMENNMNMGAKNNLAIPFAIIIAGALVAGAVMYGNGGLGKRSGQANNQAETGDSGKKENIALREVSGKDHIRGNPNASVKLVEFSDPECPFCKRFHLTMQKVMEEYGKSGKVAWVYRHFPLDSIHSKARKESEALECAGEQGGNAKFWDYLDRLMEITPSNNGLDLAQLPKIAEYVGLDSAKFKQCLDGGKYAEVIGNDLSDGMNAGVQGTPHSVILSKKGKKIVVSGAQPYESVKASIEQALAE